MAKEFVQDFLLELSTFPQLQSPLLLHNRPSPQILLFPLQLFLFNNFPLACPAFFCRNSGCFFFRAFGELLREVFEAAYFIEVLAPLVAADHHDAGRPMVQPHRTFGLVLVLPALAAGRESVDVAEGEEPVVGFGHRSRPIKMFLIAVITVNRMLFKKPVNIVWQNTQAFSGLARVPIKHFIPSFNQRVFKTFFRLA